MSIFKKQSMHSCLCVLHKRTAQHSLQSALTAPQMMESILQHVLTLIVFVYVAACASTHWSICS